MPKMDSSYKKNNYGEVFRAIVQAFKPVNCVELGVLNGYSTINIAAGLKENGRGTLNAYDLFEEYPYKHSQYEDVKVLTQHCPMIVLHRGDAFKVYEQYGPGSVDLLHVDLSNTGEIVRRVMEQWDEKMVQGGVILFEGGTVERDLEEWMVKYSAPSIKKEIETNLIINSRYVYGAYLKWPGLTMLLKKR